MPRQHRGGSEKPGELDRARLSAAHEPSDGSWTRRVFPSWDTTPRTSTFGVAYSASQANRSSTRLVSPPDPWAIISAAIVRIVVYRSMSYGFSAKVKPVWARVFSLRAHSSQVGSITMPLHRKWN